MRSFASKSRKDQKQVPVHAGSLLKKSKKGLFWNERWVVLTSTKDLFVKNDQNDAVVKQIVPLEYASVSIMPRRGRKFPFKVTTALGSIFIFATEEQLDCERWVEEIQMQTRANNKLRPLKGQSMSDQNNESLENPSECPEPVHEEIFRKGWNDLFQEALEIEETDLDKSISKGLRVNGVVHKFAEKCSRQVRIIVDERNLLFSEKSIQPIENCEILEEQTFVSDGIVFRFASEDDSKSSRKGISNELQGLRAYLNASQGDISTTLCCSVDYLGFRVFAFALLPIGYDSSSMMYGLSSDENEWIACDESAEQVVSAVSQQIGLKGHQVCGRLIYCSSTVKLHEGDDGRMYLTDASRALPIDVAFQKRADCLSQFRLEFLHHVESSISADAYKEGFSSDIDDVEASEGSRLLLSRVSEFAVALDNLEFLPLVPSELTSLMHDFGLNLRYLGIITTECRLPHVRELAIISMISRVCKTLLNERLRKQTDVSVEEVLYLFFDLIFGESLQSKDFWDNQLFPRLTEKFQYSSPINHSNLNSVLLRREIEQQTYCFMNDGVLEIIPRVKLVGVEYLACFELAAQAEEFQDQLEFEKALEAFQVRLDVVLGDKELVGREKSFRYYATLASLAKTCFELGKLEQTRSWALRAIESSPREDPQLCLVYLQLFRLFHVEQNEEASTRALNESIRIAQMYSGTHHPVLLEIYDTAAKSFIQSEQFDRVEYFLTEALKLARIALGRRHECTLSFENRLSHAFMLSGKLELALAGYLDTLNTFMTLSPPNEFAASKCHMFISDIFERLDNLEQAAFHAEMALGYTNCMEHYEQLASLLTKQGDFAKAVDILEQALEGLKQSGESNVEEIRLLSLDILSISFRMVPELVLEKILNRLKQFDLDTLKAKQFNAISGLFEKGPSVQFRSALRSTDEESEEIDELVILFSFLNRSA